MTERLTLTLSAALRDASSHDPQYRLAAAERLWGNHDDDPAVLPALRGLVSDPMGPIRHLAFLGLRQASATQDEHHFREGLSDSFLGVRQVCLQGLVSVRSHDALEQVQRSLEAEDPESRENALYCLADGWPAEAAQQIPSYLKDPDVAVRVAAAQTLAELREPSSQDALFEALSDDTSTVRRRAASALVQFGDRRALPHLIEALQSAPEETDRLTCLEDIGTLGDASALPQLQRLANRPFVSLMERAGAGAAMYRIDSSRGLSQLQSVLRAWRTYARPYAVSLIGTYRIHELKAELERLRRARYSPDNLDWALAELSDHGAADHEPLQ